MMGKGRIILLSDTNREDVYAFWRASVDIFWPDCSIPVGIMNKSTELCWSRRLLNLLDTVREDWVLLWVDDSVLRRPVLVQDFERCLHYFLEHDDIALFHVGRSTSREGLIPIPEMEPFAYYPQTLDWMTHAMCPHPTLWRKEALLQVTKDAVLRATPEQDDGWAGFYNWELGGGYVLVEHGWQAVNMIGDWVHDTPKVPIRHCNAVRQGLGWTGCALKVAERINFTLSPGRGLALRAEECPTPGSDKWRAAGHVVRRK